MELEREADATAGRWLGIGVAAAPAIEVADTGGLFSALASPSSFEAGDLVPPLLWVAFFCAIGVAAAWLLPRHGPAGRRRFVAACATPVALWILYSALHSGLRPLALIPALAFALCIHHLRR